VRIVFRVLSSIGFDDETRFRAEEIYDVVPYWMLASESESRELLATQM